MSTPTRAHRRSRRDNPRPLRTRWLVGGQQGQVRRSVAGRAARRTEGGRWRSRRSPSPLRAARRSGGGRSGQTAWKTTPRGIGSGVRDFTGRRGTWRAGKSAGPRRAQVRRRLSSARLRGGGTPVQLRPALAMLVPLNQCRTSTGSAGRKKWLELSEVETPADALVGDFAQLAQAENLETARVSEQAARPGDAKVCKLPHAADGLRPDADR